ncbi:hypothetical protein FOL47_001318 [Perkinsus chesapeaki]|uniref:EF-hand domain-containing protein n=1 Tax=Perkinsus chesapeaki TaxID=330153 RepID=A0A7J6ML39_PERCH|nr:hypothetical protein FOL47_001318 [Perkinsus chesapeaki]
MEEPLHESPSRSSLAINSGVDEREVFYIFDSDADGRLTPEEFREALRVCGAQITDEEFTNEILIEFGSQPNIIVFSSAVAVCRERNVDREAFKKLLNPLMSGDDTISRECLDYLLNRAKGTAGLPAFSEDEIAELLDVAQDSDGGSLRVDRLCDYLRLIRPPMLARNLSFGKSKLAGGLWLKCSTRAMATVNLAPGVVKHVPNREPYKGPLKACILDWSGTTADAHVLAPAVVFVEVFRKFGVEISMKEARLPMGLRKDLHIAKILEIPEVQERWRKIKGRPSTAGDVEAMFRDFVPMQCAVLPKYSTLIDGAADTVKLLKSKYNLQIGSTTGFTKVMVDILLEKAKEQGYIPDSSVAGDEVPNNMGFRPAPFMIYQNLCNLGVFPIESVVKVDDTVSGVGEGLSAGCWSVGVAGLSNYTDIDTLEQWETMPQSERERRIQISREKLNTSGAHYVIDTIKDLPVVIEDINSRMLNGDKPYVILNINGAICYQPTWRQGLPVKAD